MWKTSSRLAGPYGIRGSKGSEITPVAECTKDSRNEAEWVSAMNLIILIALFLSSLYVVVIPGQEKKKSWITWHKEAVLGAPFYLLLRLKIQRNKVKHEDKYLKK
jgi:hypothetical protein